MTRTVLTSLGFALACAAGGCASSSTVLRPMPSETQAEVNRVVAGRDAELVLEGQSPKVGEVRVGENSVWFRQREKIPTLLHAFTWLPEVEVPLTSVHQIEVRDRGRGALHGLAIGTPIGVVLGAIGGALVGGICERPGCAAPFARIGALAGGAGLGLIGAGLGAAIGARRTIEFKSTPAAQ
jgi:hypothetical protein